MHDKILMIGPYLIQAAHLRNANPNSSGFEPCMALIYIRPIPFCFHKHYIHVSLNHGIIPNTHIHAYMFLNER